MPVWNVKSKSKKTHCSERLEHVLELTKKIFGDSRFKSNQLKKIMGHVPDYEAYLANKVKLRTAYEDCYDLDMKPGFIEPLLTHKQERHLFAKFNYLKAKARNAAIQGRTSRAEAYLKRAMEVKEMIALANMRLAISIGGKIRSHILDRSVIINEAYFQLLRVIDLFDWTKKVVPKLGPNKKPRPVKFSTLATYGIQHAMWRSTQVIHTKEGKKQQLKDTDSKKLEKDIGKEKEVQQQFNKKAVLKLLESLNERDREIICLRYGIDCEAHMLKDIGKMRGVSAEYIRQLEKEALAKMKFAMISNFPAFSETCIA